VEIKSEMGDRENKEGNSEKKKISPKKAQTPNRVSFFRYIKVKTVKKILLLSTFR
jgi:hypothetical protein